MDFKTLLSKKKTIQLPRFVSIRCDMKMRKMPDASKQLDQSSSSDLKVMSQEEEEEKSKKTNFWQRFHIKKQHKTQIEVVSIQSLFRYATIPELFYIVLGTIASLAFGVCLPLALIPFGAMVDSFIDHATNLCSFNLTSLTQQYCPSNVTLTSINFYTIISLCNVSKSNFTLIHYDIKVRTNKQVIILIIIGFVNLISGYIRVILLETSAERQTRTIRQILFQSILKKDVVFFDTHKTGELSVRLTDDINKIHDGIGNKFGSVIEVSTTFTSCIIIGFIKGWKLSLVIFSFAPIIFITLAILLRIVTRMTAIELKAYGRAGIVAEEVISSIRTVLSYNGQEREVQRYEQYLDDAKKCGIRKGVTTGIITGVTYFLLFCTYALGFWYGTKLVWEESYTIGNVFTIFMCITGAFLTLGQASPYFQALYEARVAAYGIWEVIDEPSKINNMNSDKGLIKDDLIGDIHFSNVYFSYPSRPDVPILTNLSFNIKFGQTVALVGSSGSGKSTCIQLLQRFYDPQLGSILIDGKQVNQYNLKWLRKHIGVVNQEPVLFHTTIRQNILFGSDSATNEEIYQAAKIANAHDFIMTLPNKYETLVGERGAALSGGQKQRIAIARALLRDPKILLLDEATSSLDNESEKIVQKALDRVAQGRTTLIIAHRLSTILNADKIIVMQQGEIVEEGDHDSLMKAQGIYFDLVKQQNLRQLEEEEEEESEMEQKEITQLIPGDQTNDDSMEQVHHKLAMDSGTESVISAVHEIKSSLAGDKFHKNDDEKMSKLKVFQECNENVQKQKVFLYILLYLIFGVISLVSPSIQGYFFAQSGEALTKRLRSKAFRAILRQEIAYFDQENHSTGALCTRLATEASAVKSASGVRFGLIFQHIFGMIVGILIGFVYSWQLTLLMLVFLPFILFGGILEIRLTTYFASKDKQILENAGKVAIETIQNIRTVIQLTKETHFYDEYSQILDTLHRSSIKRVHILAILFSVANAAIYFATAAFTSYSTFLFEQRAVPFENGFMVLNTVVFAARTIAQELALFPDYGKAIQAAENIFKLLNRKPTIDNQSKDGIEMTDFTGQLDFEDVYFYYPNRPQSTILRNFKLNIKPGQNIALVGTSGCGKSTTIQLIERFYDVNMGRLLIDSKDIRTLNLQWYRSQIGIVSQEPVLFDMSIRENIAYGDNSRKDIPLDEIIQVAKNANIHDFIKVLPDGYETNCGAKGTQLSGGQKQRIAIARALLRNPKILLLDEATSALDSENEKIVQDALNRAQQNRTSITIAHRLSTIQNADMIFVFHNGIIVESGNHEELLALGGRYYRLATINK
ncbi:unnamed protein product [Rotaria sordida]|uniref:ABC-type xenobiotic transporter n=3 Tax=Rotaria sordida TaxID=392033 RepID=A0A814BUY8_9BILA|nr:unnamed protein product [Rotaria sordida]